VSGALRLALCAGGLVVLLIAAASSAAKAAPPVNISPPLIAIPIKPGLAGRTAICTTGTWKNAPTSFAYQWLKDGASIPGATTATYTFTSDDYEHVFACKVTAKNSAGTGIAVSADFEVGPMVGPDGIARPKLFNLPDHFKCYQATQRELPLTRKVSLIDQFGAGEAALGRVERLCNPVSKNGGHVFYAGAHLVCDGLLHVSGGLSSFHQVLINNQFGSQLATVTNTEQLCIPSLKIFRLAPKGPSPAKVLDHYQCYRVTPARPSVSATVSLTDQFMTSATRVTRLVQLCNPVSKNNEPVLRPWAHLACYLAQDVKRQPGPLLIKGNFIGVAKGAVDVETENQFGSLHLTVFTPRTRTQRIGLQLCVPSQKVDQTPKASCSGSGTACSGAGASCSIGAACTGPSSTCTGDGTSCSGAGSSCSSGATCSGDASFCSFTARVSTNPQFQGTVSVRVFCGVATDQRSYQTLGTTPFSHAFEQTQSGPIQCAIATRDTNDDTAQCSGSVGARTEVLFRGLDNPQQGDRMVVVATTADGSKAVQEVVVGGTDPA
jgi:hypothetical protein